MKHFLDPTAEPVQSPPAGRVRWKNLGMVITMEVVPHREIVTLADALNEPSFADYRREQCGAGKVRSGERWMVITSGRDVNATLAVLRAQIARLTDITEWEEVQP